MKFQASFLENHINISTKECNRIFGLGRITFSVATGSYGALSILFPVHELDALRDIANSLLELCFSSKKGEDKLSAYYKCEEEFSLSGGCILSEKKLLSILTIILIWSKLIGLQSFRDCFWLK